MSAIFNLRNGLIALAIALAAALGFETDWGEAFTASTPAPRSVSGKHDSAMVLPDFRLSTETANYAQISERPLLNPTRKPAPTQVVVAATEPPKPQVRRGLYQLVGVMDLGAVKIAQVREIASNRTKSVREGDLLQEMTVQKVGATQVTLAFQGETDVIDLAKFTASGRVPQPAPYVPPAPVMQPALTQSGMPVGPTSITPPAPTAAAPTPNPVAAVNAAVDPAAQTPPGPIPGRMGVREVLEARRLARSLQQ